MIVKQGPFLFRWGSVLVVIFLASLVAFSFRDRNFWQTADQRGEALYRSGRFAQAAKTYTDPWHIGLALYRNGDFEAAAKNFAECQVGMAPIIRGMPY